VTLMKTRWATSIVVMVLFSVTMLAALIVHRAPNSVRASQAQGVLFENLAARGTSAVDEHPASASSQILYLPTVYRDRESRFPSPFGVQLYGSITESKNALSSLGASRATWVRWPISWSSIEPTQSTPAQYRWSIDASIRAAYESDLELIVTISDNPAWASTYRNGPIDKVDLQRFVQFVVALVERYDGDGVADAPGSPKVKYWEFYNEPDAGVELNASFGASYWGPYGADYARMLCAVYPAIKAANPEAQIVFGGIAYDHFLDGEGRGAFVREFLGDVLKAGGGECFDIMNFHYYPPFEPNWLSYGPGLAGKAAHLRQTYDLGEKPMMVTEAGWHSHDYSVYPSSPQMQAGYVVKLFTQAMYSDIQALTWWTWIDPGGGYGPNGLLTQQFIPKPAYTVFRDAARRLGTATPSERLYLSNRNIEVYRFTSASGQPLFVLWSRDDQSHMITLPLAKGQIVDMYGNRRQVVTDGADGRYDGRITVSAGIDPLYVEAIP
jgi:hypothetical protein